MTNSEINPFPAVMIGGPPHSGKSVLTYSLSQSLRENKVDHYVLRACPDGEGDFSQEAQPATVQLIRQKGRFNPLFVARVSHDLQKRHLPLLVDVGGKPTPEQEVILTHCTHAILIASTVEGLAEWRTLAQRCDLEIIAELHSQLDQEDALGKPDALFGATIGGLRRGQRVAGDVCRTLIRTLQALFEPSQPWQRTAHLAAAPCEIVAEVDRVRRGMGWDDDPNRWHFNELPLLLDYLPAQTEIALYGRAPAWVYCSAAIHAQPALFHLFDVRLGWVAPVTVELCPTPNFKGGQWQQIETKTYTTVNLQLGEHYLFYDELVNSQAPSAAYHKGVVISCKGPFWLQSGLAIAYAQANLWVAIYHPNQERAVVVYSSTPMIVPGQTIATPRLPLSITS